ncbi:MAG: c-type cytochrome domain-containing protein [Sphingomonadales bacterium]
MFNRNYLVLFFGIAAVLFACTHEATSPNGGSTPPSFSATCSADSVYFVSEILPIITSNCAMSGCHSASSRADGVQLTNYSTIMKYVQASSATRSKLYKVIIDPSPGDRMPPPPRSPLTATQIAKIQKWINQGAKNNSCGSACDVNTFTYAGTIKPLLDNKCVGCHSSVSPGGNINLSTHTLVRTVALNGKLYGSIAHQTGFSPMPKNSAKLSDCEITQVQRWIAAGALNN